MGSIKVSNSSRNSYSGTISFSLYLLHSFVKDTIDGVGLVLYVIDVKFNDIFYDCPMCDNRAEHMIDLRSNPNRQAIRNQVNKVQTIQDLENILDQLE